MMINKLKCIIYEYEPNKNNVFEDYYEKQLPFQCVNLYIPYKRRFTVNEFINYLKLIFQGLYYNKCKQFLKYLVNDNYSFVISSGSINTEIMEYCFTNNDILEFINNKENKLSIFIVNNNKYCDDEKYSFLVRFTSNNDYINKYSQHFVYERCIGRPERIWFDKGDSIWEIFNNLNYNSKIYYFHNIGREIYKLNKSPMPTDKPLYDVIIDPTQNIIQNKTQCLLISVADHR